MRRQVIVCVDDEKMVLVALKEQLLYGIKDEFNVETAESGEEALDIIGKLISEGIEIPVIIADYLMPGIRGDELLIRIQSILPSTLKIMLTGQADAVAVGNVVNKARLYRYIAKPWDKQDLILTIREALKSHWLQRKITIINTITRHVNSILEPGDLLKYLLTESLKISSAAGGLICLLNNENQRLEVKETIALDLGQTASLLELSAVSLIESGSDAGHSRNAAVRDAVLAIPIKLKEKVIGVMCLQRADGENFFTEDDVEIHEILMGEAAIALENAFQFRKRLETEKRLKEIIEAIIDTMALTLEKKDPYTAGHQRRVADLAQAIAKEMGLPPDMVDGIKVAGTIHDIGKIAVPTEILSKPGKLNDAEFSLIKRHPEAGYEVLKNIVFPWPVAEIIYQHHELLNGQGYPRGLKEGEIMLEAKIIACADVIEAIASDRPYRPALGLDVALDEINKYKGTKYDPRVVDACFRLFKERGYKLATGVTG